MTMKNVQMHMLARNSAKLLESPAPNNYGRHLTYHKAYNATSLDAQEHYFVEPYIQGELDNYINNTLNYWSWPQLWDYEELRGSF